MTTLHYTSGSGGLGTAIAADGFNLVDVQSVDQLNALPAGMKGLVWLDEYSGTTASFIQKVTPFIGNPKLFGFFLVDEPDPTGKWGTYVTAANLMAESDWIHSNVPGAKTFITMMNMGSSANPDFSNTYNPANTHIDYYGLDPYPVRTGVTTIDYNMIDRTVAAAEASGIPASQIVPVFQAFGGGSYTTDTGGQYVIPTPAQEQTMMAHWAALVPSPAFDYAYAWGSQQGDTPLGSDPALQAVFLQHNTSSTTGTTSSGTGSSSSGTGTSGTGTSGTGTGTSGTGTSGTGTSGTGSSPGTGTPTGHRSHGGHTLSDTLSAGVLHATTSAETLIGTAASGGVHQLLTGNGGGDVFVFNTALTPGNVPRITDFNVAQDKIQLDHTIFTGLQPGALPAADFHIGKGAINSSEHIIYNSSTGALSFDVDGSGSAHQVHFATLASHLSLTAASFVVT